MASWTNGSENSLALLVFNATNWANIADNTATAPATNIYVSLHNADPGEAGSQTTNETAYTNYVRIAVARTAGGFTVSGTDPTQVVNAATITFAQCGLTGDTLTHFGLGLASSGAGTLLMSGPLGAGPVYDFTNDASNNITIPGTAMAVNDRVSFYHNQGGTPGTGITEGVIYWIKTAASNVYTISTTQGGAAVTISALGSGIAIKSAPLVVSTLVTPSFAASALKAVFD